MSATTAMVVVAGRMTCEGAARAPPPPTSSVKTAAIWSPQAGLKRVAPDCLPCVPCALPPCMGHSAPGSTLQSHRSSLPPVAVGVVWCKRTGAAAMAEI